MARRCPICRTEIDEKGPHRPFCSKRCQDVDLGRWINEEYRISRPMTPAELQAALPVAEDGEDEDEDEALRRRH